MNPIHSVLLGTAIGDSLGLPAENMRPDRIARRWPGPWRHRFVFGRGMVSDDTEHTIFVAQCLAGGSVDAAEFQRRLVKKLRWWVLCGPPGIGLATLKACWRLWLGFPPSRAGVFSAGNGPSMRSAVIGVAFAGDRAKIREFVRASSRLTHTDPKAETAALAVALTAEWAVRGARPEGAVVEELRNIWLSAGPDDAEWTSLVERLVEGYRRGIPVGEFASELGLQRGVTGYSYHTVPVALYAWLRHHGAFRAGLEAVLVLGGDTDSVAAIAGALLAINSQIPKEWLTGLVDYPISRGYLERLGDALSAKNEGRQGRLQGFPWIVLPARNAFCVGVILGHVVRRRLY